jgi:hypothetical protein
VLEYASAGVEGALEEPGKSTARVRGELRKSRKSRKTRKPRGYR